MYRFTDYLHRGTVFLHNKYFPSRKKISSLMIYATDLCDSACRHCLIWTKRPVQFLPKEKIFEIISTNRCITRRTAIGLEGGEFMLHPDAPEILAWLKKHHPKFDLLSNCLKPAELIQAVKKYPPKRLWISLDGDRETYHSMRGKDGYEKVLHVIESLKNVVPVSVMFTLTPYNDFSDMKHVAEVCKKNQVDLRIGIYNNIPLFDTIEKAHTTEIGSAKNYSPLHFAEAKKRMAANQTQAVAAAPASENAMHALSFKESIPSIVKEFPENYDFLVLYDEWRRGGTHLNCHSILESLVILPNGDVPICQNLNVILGNIYHQPLDEIFNSAASQQTQLHYSKNCNACWINFHRKYDIVLYRSFENFFGKAVTRKLLGYYWWEHEKRKSYKQFIRHSL